MTRDGVAVRVLPHAGIRFRAQFKGRNPQHQCDRDAGDRCRHDVGHSQVLSASREVVNTRELTRGSRWTRHCLKEVPRVIGHCMQCVHRVVGRGRVLRTLGHVTSWAWRCVIN